MPWPALVSRIDAQIDKQVEVPVALATQTASKANVIANVILAQLEDKQENLNQSIGRLGGKFDEMHVRYGEASAQIDTVEEHVGEVRQLTEFLKGRVQTNPVSREELTQLDARLTEIVSQTAVLAAAIKKLGSGATGQSSAVTNAEEQLKRIYEEQTSAAENAKATDANPRINATAYVQFAGGKRGDMELISKNLQDVGWTVPGEERIGTAAGKREVRYFHDSDAEAASLLAKDVNKAIIAVGFKPMDVVARKAPVKNLPAVGIIELWLEIPLR